MSAIDDDESMTTDALAGASECKRAKLNDGLSGKFSTHEVVVQELGLESCVMTHNDRLRLGARAELRFSWGDHLVSRPGCIVRSTIDSVDLCVVRYRSEIEFEKENSDDSAKLRTIMARMPV